MSDDAGPETSYHLGDPAVQAERALLAAVAPGGVLLLATAGRMSERLSCLAWARIAACPRTSTLRWLHRVRAGQDRGPASVSSAPAR